MKKIIVSILILLPVLLLAQNPDGRSASLHITPSWLWGNSNYDRYAPYYIPATQVTYDKWQMIRDTGTIQYPSAFGLDVMLKIPTASFLTISLSYSYYQRFEEIYTPYNVNNIYYYWSIKGQMHKISVTASVYNLFSIY